MAKGSPSLTASHCSSRGGPALRTTGRQASTWPRPSLSAHVFRGATTQRDPETFDPLGTVDVHRDGDAIDRLNELECIGDHVVANVWQTDEIVVIDPASGTVQATIDASILSEEIDSNDGGAVLNGIADPGDGTLLLAGKLWPVHFIVRIVG